MTDERLFERLAAHAGPADIDSGFEDRLYVLLQQEMNRSGRSARPMLLLVAALLAILTISAAVAVGSGVVELPWLDESPTPTVAPTPDSPEPSASMLPGLGMPGRGGNPAGVYGWNGPLGASTWMHHVVAEGFASGSREIVIVFVNRNCFAGWTGPEPVPVTIGGLDGRYVEPYEYPPGVNGFPRFGPAGAYALPVGDRTLCVYLSWDAATTPEELEAARQVVESIRAQPYGQDGIRINFTLPAGWDTG